MAPVIEMSVAGRIEEEIVSLLRPHRKLTFLAIADFLPEYDWRSLLQALNRLRERRRVELIALRWDYEVVLVPSRRSSRGHAAGRRPQP